MPIFAGLRNGMVSPTTVVVRQSDRGIRVYVTSYITPQTMILLAHNPDMIPPAYLYQYVKPTKTRYVGYLFPSWVQFMDRIPANYLEWRTSICAMVCVYDLPNTSYIYEFTRLWKSFIIPCKVSFKMGKGAIRVCPFTYRLDVSEGRYRRALMQRFMLKYGDYYKRDSLFNIISGGSGYYKSMVHAHLIPILQKGVQDDG